MKRIALCLTIAALTAHGSSQLQGQILPLNDWGSFGVVGGVLAPQTTFADPSGGESKLESGFALGATATVWPTRGRLGIKAQVVRSETDGTNTIVPLAALAVNDPVQWIVTGEAIVRQPVDFGAVVGFPYLSVGVGGKQYNWAVSVHQEDRFFLWTAALGAEARPSLLGRLALNFEARTFLSKFRAFGIEDTESWEPGFYGGNVDGVNNFDLLFSTGLFFVF